MRPFILGATALIALAPNLASADDLEGCEEHPAVSRYPGTDIVWCETENYRQYKVPMGPVTGYRTIGDMKDVEGRLVRTAYKYEGTDRTQAEVWKNYSDALKEGGFEVIAEGMLPQSNVKNEVGGGTWIGVYLGANKWVEGGAVNAFLAGTSSSGGTGAIVATKERADDTIYAVVLTENHSEDEVFVLVDILETKAAETGLVTADSEAMGRDIEELGRTVIDGLMFDHDKATLKPESGPALVEAAKLLATMADRNFYVVGHTDSTGTFAYNQKLSSDRAAEVRRVLVEEHGVASERLQSHGVGPLSPVFTNSAEGGRSKNRRVELVEQ
jgi:outer membrane protein OmpA-like peptidoglycan-associated protein